MGEHIKRNEYLKEHVEGKDVLDLGSQNHGKTTDLFDFIKKHAKSVIGLDILPSERDDIVQGNVEDLGNIKGLTPDKKFDVIVAGELIEHLNNQAAFLNGIKQRLKPDGKFILTTPNCLSLYYWFRGNPNPEHTCWFDASVLTRLLENNGLKATQVKYYSRQTRRPQNWIFQRIADMFPRQFHLHLFFVCEKK